MRRRAAAACLLAAFLLLASSATRAAAAASSAASRRDVVDLEAESSPSPPQTAAGSATHPLTVHVEYQLQGVPDGAARLVRDIVSTSLTTLGDIVHMAGAQPRPLRLPRSCALLQQWRRDGKAVGAPECIQPLPVRNCLQAAHNASLFDAITVCSGQRPGDCRAVGQPSQAASLAADLVLYVTADGGGLAACGTSAASPPRTRTGSSAILAAAGGACEMDASGRPVAGAINICPARLDLLLASSTAPNVASTDSVVLDVLHEMMHVLAFSEGLYASFASASAKNGSGIAPGPRGGLLVQSPAVLAVARRHFGCPSLRGVPLETEGGNGTARTHWRLRALNGELMVGTVVTGQRPVLSNFTLAFLQDTGWYLPRFGAAEPLPWGADAGCDFVTSRACDELSGKAASFFCSMPAAQSSAVCTRDNLAVGTCSMLPLTRADERCGAVQPYSNWACRDAAFQDPDRARWGNAFGPGARCLLGGSTPWSRRDAGGRLEVTQERAVPGCFAVGCNASGALHATIDGVRVDCPEGQTVNLPDVPGLRFKAGKLGPCPPATAVCASLRCPRDCNGTGSCSSDGACRCWPGYEGPDCATLAP